MAAIRHAAVAGRFYPDDPNALAREVDTWLPEADPPALGTTPRALIVPHAGYIYSGPVAATGYALWLHSSRDVERVIMLGTGHTKGLSGLVATNATTFETPLGIVPVDTQALERVLDLPQVVIHDRAHAVDHALEVQLPFLLRTLGPVPIVPFLVGEAAPDEVSELLNMLDAGSPTVRTIVSSDLSHYYPYTVARRMDRAAADAIEALDPSALSNELACGHHAIRGLLSFARDHNWQAVTLDLRNSGDTAGPRDEVVGYGAFAFGPGLRAEA